MIRKKQNKRWNAILLAGILTAGFVIPPMESNAAGTYTKSGSFHIQQFGEYDINTDVDVEEGKITGVKVEGENFGGTYADVNRGKLQSAIDGIVDKLIGLFDTDVEKIGEIDAVSGATISSNGIKEAVKDALELESVDKGTGEVPDGVPEAGVYHVAVGVRSDVVDHSLVESDTADAVLTVEENGEMRLSYTMISGTDKEPMYVLGFDGYYEENNPENGLTMEGVEFATEEKDGYTVVTDVSFPLTGLSQYYYNSTYLYVPVMSNLNGEVNGVLFENGKFHIKTIVTVYWDTLKKEGEGDSSSKDMQVSAEIAKDTSSPSYSVSVPSSVSMGTLSAQKDNIQKYDITVTSSSDTGTISVSAPESGALNHGKDKLSFVNEFGTQTVNLAEKASAKNDDSEILLSGEIKIAGKDILEAAAGNYTGTTTFQIQYTEEGDLGTDPEPEPEPEPVDPKNLEDGIYSIHGELVKTDKSTTSMADDAINHTVKLTVKDGVYYLTLDFAGLEVGGQLGYLSEMKYFKTGYTTNKYGEPQGALASGTVDSFQLNADGSKVSDKYGTDYPDLVTFEMIPEALEDGYVPLQVVVALMENVSPGLGVQSVYLKLDWSTLKTATDDDFISGGDQGEEPVLPGGSGLPGGSLLGGSGLPGGSSLGGNLSLGGTSGLGSASTIKTGDSGPEMIIWVLLLIISTGTVVTGVIRKKYEQKKQ